MVKKDMYLLTRIICFDIVRHLNRGKTYLYEQRKP